MAYLASFFGLVYNFIRPAFFHHQGKLDVKNKLVLYSITVYLLFCCYGYLREPLVVNKVELHKLLLYARWPPQAVHLWPWSYTCELTLAQRFSLMSSVSTNMAMPKCFSYLCTANFIWSWRWIPPWAIRQQHLFEEIRYMHLNIPDCYGQCITFTLACHLCCHFAFKVYNLHVHITVYIASY